jgi:hypothetical protein
LQSSLDRKQAMALAFYWYHGTALFNAKLSQPVKPDERDALWAAAALLGTTAFADIQARTPEEAWPLAPPSPMDLDWLKMTDGKKVVWELANPLRSDSLFNAIANDHDKDIPPKARIGAEMANLPTQLADLLDLNVESTLEANPYHASATILAQLMPVECDRSTIVWFLSFLRYLDPRFKTLLDEKDPRALLLLSYWYAKVLRYSQWWIWRRAILEGPAICMYLEQQWPQHRELGMLLDFPKAAFHGGGRFTSLRAGDLT